MQRIITNSDRLIKSGSAAANRYCPVTPDAGNRYAPRMKLRLREFRLARGLTQSQVAERVGISQGYLAEIERGKKQINANRLEAFARFYKVHPGELIESGTNDSAEVLAQRIRLIAPEDLPLLETFLAGLIAKQSGKG